MPRTCTICAHPERQAIDEALVDGASMRELAAKYRVSPDAIARHNAAHLPAKLARAAQAKEVAAADSLLVQVQTLQRRTLGILGKAERAADLRAAVGAIREARGNLELLAKLTGELDERPQVNILLLPQWQAIEQALVEVIEPHQVEAFRAKVAALPG